MSLATQTDMCHVITLLAVSVPLLEVCRPAFKHLSVSCELLPNVGSNDIKR